MLLINQLELLKLDRIHDLQVTKFVYEMKVKCLSYNNMQEMISIIIPIKQKKREISMKLRGMRIWNSEKIQRQNKHSLARK